MSEEKTVRYHDWLNEHDQCAGTIQCRTITVGDGRSVSVGWSDGNTEKELDAGYQVVLLRELADGRVSRLEFKVTPEALVAMVYLAEEQGLDEKFSEYKKEEPCEA